MPKSSYQQVVRGGSKAILSTLKKVSGRAIGSLLKEPDPKALKELVALVTEAERAGDRRVIQALASKGMREIILFAAEGGHVTLVKALLEAGVKPNLELGGVRPIYPAARAGQSEVIEVLVRAGENPSAEFILGTPVAILAAKQGHAEAVRRLVQLGANAKAKAKMGGTTLLTAVAAQADAGLIRLIADKGGDVNEADDDGQTPLMLAAQAGNLEAVQELIRLKAKVNAASRLRSVEQIQAEGRGEHFDDKMSRRIRASRTDPRETALMLAAEGGHTKVVEVLLKAGADPKARDEDGKTAIDRATENGYARIVHLLRRGKLTATPKLGVSDLLQAAGAGNLDVVRAAIKARVALNAKDKARYTPPDDEGCVETSGGKPALVLAAERGDMAMVKALLAAGADPNVCADATSFDNGQNALHVAAEKGNVKLVRTLLAAGADVNAKEVGRPDIPGKTALQLATESRRTAVVKELLRATERRKGKRPAISGLHEAAREGRENLVPLLLKQGADIEARSEEEDWTPLMLACFGGYAGIAQQLLRAGADVNAMNELGQTALKVAVHGAWVRSDWNSKKRRAAQTLATIRLLLKRGANVNVAAWDDQTPLDMAIGSDLKSIATLLRKAGGMKAEDFRKRGRKPRKMSRM